MLLNFCKANGWLVFLGNYDRILITETHERPKRQYQNDCDHQKSGTDQPVLWLFQPADQYRRLVWVR